MPKENKLPFGGQMAEDLNIAVLNATYKLEQSDNEGRRVVGTVWLVNLGSKSNPKIALVSAHHVLDGMKRNEAVVHWRAQDDNGNWHRYPTPIAIRDDNGNGIWLHHPEKDIAVMWINAPESVVNNAIMYENLAGERTISDLDINLGDEMLALGYPKGLSANDLGFPILRSGKVASYPIVPIRQFPSFLMDFSVFSGNSGGPVYMSDKILSRTKDNKRDKRFIAGLLTQQVNIDSERLEIGIVLHASFIKDMLKELAGDEDDLIS